jgi:hypothetical protein
MAEIHTAREQPLPAAESDSLTGRSFSGRETSRAAKHLSMTGDHSILQGMESQVELSGDVVFPIHFA